VVLALACRAANTPRDSTFGVTLLLDALREASAEDQVRTLIDRLPAEGTLVSPASKLIIRCGTDSAVSPTEARPRHGGPARGL
jgi:hypothetical protein